MKNLIKKSLLILATVSSFGALQASDTEEFVVNKAKATTPDFKVVRTPKKATTLGEWEDECSSSDEYSKEIEAAQAEVGLAEAGAEVARIARKKQFEKVIELERKVRVRKGNVHTPQAQNALREFQVELALGSGRIQSRKRKK